MAQPHWSSRPWLLQAVAWNPREKDIPHTNATLPPPAGERYLCHSQGGQLDQLRTWENYQGNEEPSNRHSPRSRVRHWALGSPEPALWAGRVVRMPRAAEGGQAAFLTGSSHPSLPCPPHPTASQSHCGVEILEEKTKTFCKQVWCVCNHPEPDL